MYIVNYRTFCYVVTKLQLCFDFTRSFLVKTLPMVLRMRNLNFHCLYVDLLIDLKLSNKIVFIDHDPWFDLGGFLRLSTYLVRWWYGFLSIVNRKHIGKVLH